MKIVFVVAMLALLTACSASTPEKGNGTPDKNPTYGDNHN